jgi:predicted aspartyl protease
MPVLTLKFAALETEGATLDVRIAPPVELAGARRRFPDSLPPRAMIDTGASTTVLKRGVPSSLGLKPTSDAQVHTASSSWVSCDEFAISLFLTPSFKIRTTALELPLGAPGIDCLIGRDVLAQCVMTYIGPENQVILSFPL